MNKSKLERIAMLNEIRSQCISSARDVKIMQLEEIYGRWDKDPEKCLLILIDIYRNGTFTVNDPVFQKVDDRYTELIDKAKDSKKYSKNKEFYDQLDRIYGKLLNRLDNLNSVSRVYFKDHNYQPDDLVEINEIEQEPIGPLFEDLERLDKNLQRYI